jgi:hypothetical protein
MYADLYLSLFDYLLHGLNFSESQAAERDAAVRLVRQTCNGNHYASKTKPYTRADS